MIMKAAAVLFSGGKDSTMAAYKAMKDGWKVEYLLSMHSENPHSYMFHVPNIHLTHLLSQAMELPLIQAETPGEKEKELEDLKQAMINLKKNGVETIFTGAIHSDYQKSRIDGLCDEIGLESIAPLWHQKPLEYMQEVVDLGFKVIITSVSAEGLDESWLGRVIDEELLEELKVLNERYGLHMAFEGGEAETLVLDGPIFKKRLKILDSEKIWDRDSGHLLIKGAELVDK